MIAVRDAHILDRRKTKWGLIDIVISKENLKVEIVYSDYTISNMEYPFSYSGKHRHCGGNVYWYDGILYCRSCNIVIEIP